MKASRSQNRQRRLAIHAACVTLCASIALASSALAQGPGKHGDDGDHAAGKAHAITSGERKIYMYEGATRVDGNYSRSRAHYSVPEVSLRNRKGERVHLEKLLTREEPVALQFIFTSCATICPVLSAGIAQAREAMREIDPQTRLISISIDPDYDTPERLTAYGKRFEAGEKWTFLTGDFEDIRKVIVAFDALYEAGNKMYHRPYTYMRAAPDKPWLRLKGLMSARALADEYAALMRDGASDRGTGR